MTHSENYQYLVFSLLQKNRSSSVLIKCELQVKMNYSIDCQSLTAFIKDEKDLHKCAKSNIKYSFKYKP